MERSGAEQRVGRIRTQLGLDLVETALSNPPVVVLLKEKFSVTDTVENQGTGPARASSTRYYLSFDTSKDSGDELFEENRSVPALASGDASTGTIKLKVPAGTQPGAYYLLACADDTTLVDEADETNNCLASTTTVDVRAQSGRDGLQ